MSTAQALITIVLTLMLFCLGGYVYVTNEDIQQQNISDVEKLNKAIEDNNKKNNTNYKNMTSQISTHSEHMKKELQQKQDQIDQLYIAIQQIQSNNLAKLEQQCTTLQQENANLKERLQLIQKYPGLDQWLLRQDRIADIKIRFPKLKGLLEQNDQAGDIISKYPNLADILVQYPNILPILLDKPNVAQELSVFPNQAPAVIMYPQLSQAGLSCQSWFQIGNNWILDMTHEEWKKLSLEKQTEYSKLYQDEYAKSHQLETEKNQVLNPTAEESQQVIITLRLIPPGKFLMSENQSVVIIREHYYQAIYECTLAQWEAVMKPGNDRYANPCSFKNAPLDSPVESVTWTDVASGDDSFCGKTGLQLPTEAQWEYSCRAGTFGMTYIGDLQILGTYNMKGLSDIAWYGGNSKIPYEGGIRIEGWEDVEVPRKTAGKNSVGQKKPNAFGMYDMLGNVAEWCSNDYNSNSYGYRGGNWSSPAEEIRISFQEHTMSDDSSAGIGFRPISIK